jgi:C4-dicarboxylate transporter, DctM subunit
MNPIIIGVIGLAIFFLLMGLRMQIGFVMALVAAGGLWYVISGSAALSKLALTPFQVGSSYDLASLPLFLLMANVVFSTGLASDLYRLVAKWLGRLPGGLAIATVGGCAGFAAISSSSLATALSMGLVALPEMKKYNYDAGLATGCICAGGTLGILIPPSGVLIMYGIITQTSIGRLFMAGLIPGLLAAFMYMMVIFILCRIKPGLGPKGPASTFKEKILAFGSCGEIIALVLLVLGGLMVGWFTPAEAGAIGAFGAIVFCLIRKRLSWQKLGTAIVETVKITGMFYGIMMGAVLLQYFMAITTIPNVLGNWVATLNFPPIGIMIVIILMYIILGCFLEASAMILLTIPIFSPLVLNLGFDLVWFGIIIVRMVEIALLTPPVGMIVFNISQISKTPITKVFRGVAPFLLSDFVHVSLLLVFPAIVLWFPNLVM